MYLICNQIVMSSGLNIIARRSVISVSVEYILHLRVQRLVFNLNQIKTWVEKNEFVQGIWRQSSQCYHAFLVTVLLISRLVILVRFKNSSSRYKMQILCRTRQVCIMVNGYEYSDDERQVHIACNVM